MKSGVAGWAQHGLWRAWRLAVHRRLRDALFALFIVGILAYGAALAWYMLARLDLVDLLQSWRSYDDAFYYFQIAWHMAEGRFSTFDGLTRTNGYHPLWLLLITPFYWVFDKTEALFAIKAFEIMLVAGGVALVAVAARAVRLPWILLFAVPPALYAQVGMLSGLEAALVLFVLGLLILVACLFAREPTRWRWALAAVAFALPWARLECVAVAVAATAVLGLLELSGRLPCASGPGDARPSASSVGCADDSSLGRRRFLGLAATPLAGAFAGLLVYFVYNGVVFGGIVPVSGMLRVARSELLWIWHGGYSLAENLRAFAQSRPFDDELLIAFEVCAYALLVWWLSRRFRSCEGALLLAFTVGVFGLAAGHLAKFAQSVFFVHPQYGMHSWTFVPAYLMEALVVPLRCFVGIYVLRCLLAQRLPRTSNVLCLAGIVAAGAALVAKADFAGPFRLVGADSESAAFNRPLASYMGVEVMNRVLPTDALVGSWDSGIVGYFARFPVVNLDGAVNSYDYFQALADGPDEAAIAQLGLSYFGNRFVGSAESYGRTPTGASLAFQTYGQITPDGSESFSLYCNGGGCAARIKERMASRLEPQADGTRLLVSGRVAQAFATDCAADEVAAWAFGLPEERRLGNWSRNADGSCSSAVVLPRGHRPPLRVGRVAYGDALTYLVGRQAPLVEAHFDVHLAGRRLLYAREKCDWADVKTRFFLHLVPIGDDLDAGRESLGFNNADFSIENHGGWLGEAGSPCLAEVPLPEYRIETITTGQFNTDGKVWERVAPLDLERSADGVDILVKGGNAQAFVRECTVGTDDLAVWTFAGKIGMVSDWTQQAGGLCTSAVELPRGHLAPVRVRRAALGEVAVMLIDGRQPAIQADFDVHLEDDALIYAKETCEQRDVEAPFFLHLVPQGYDFDPGRASEGFNNADFAFGRYGQWSGEAGDLCLAVVPLPEYRIAAIRTGQYTPAGRVWEGEIRP